jgi:competence protein ComEA
VWELRLLYVVAILCLLSLALLAARRLGYWPGPKVVVTAVPSVREPLDINSAEWWELTNLAGIGETRAKAIVQARDSRKGFRSLDELYEIHGIPKSVVDTITPLVQLRPYSEEPRE